MPFNCDFEHRATGECRTVLAVLTAAEVRSVQKLTEDAELQPQALALRHAYGEVPVGFLHSKPPELVRPS